MNVIVNLCIGIICIAISHDIGVIVHIVWLPLLCDVIGGIFIAVACYFYFQIKKTDINNQKVERENLLSKFIEIEQTLKQANELLEKNYSNAMEETNEIKNIVPEIIETIKNTSDSEINHIQSVNNLIKEMQDTNNKEQREHVEKIIKQLIILKQTQDKYIGLFEKNTSLELDTLNEQLDILHKLPTNVLDIIEEYTKNINNQIEDMLTTVEDLTMDLNELENRRKDSFDKIMKNIEDHNTDCNDNLTQHIKALSDEYKQFERLSKEMIQQMTLMSQSDYEVMKGLLNG